jgi:small subunit ribosomal protein S1
MTSDDDTFASLFADSEKPGKRRAEARLGERMDVTILKIGKDAVFVSLDGKQEGYIERAELTTKEGELTVTEGARVVAKVVEIGGKAGAVRLSPLVVRSSIGDDAVAQAAPSAGGGPVLEPGLRVKGKVTRVERYGVFIQINGTYGKQGRGLIPASETGSPRGADLHKLFAVNSEVESKIVRVEEDGKIRLSITALAADEERGQFEAFAKKDKKEEAPKAPRSMGTLGDLLAKKGIGGGTK